MRLVVVLASGVLMTLGVVDASEPTASQRPPFALPGATDESRAEAMRYVEMRHAGDEVVTRLESMRIEMLRRNLADGRFSRKDLLDYTDNYLMPALRGRVGELVRMQAEIIAAKFSASEIRQLEAFLSTPAGRKYGDERESIITADASAFYAWQDAITKEVNERYLRDKAARGQNPIEH